MFVEKIVVIKDERLLLAYANGAPVMQSAVLLGGGSGHKFLEGDGCTPEGKYYVCTKNEKSKFFRSLGISYPNREDAQAAIEAGRITQEQYAQICAANDAQTRPPWDTPMGGFIMIHGEHPEGREGDWTAGCVAVSNETMAWLFEHVPMKTPVEILSGRRRDG